MFEKNKIIKKIEIIGIYVYVCMVKCSYKNKKDTQHNNIIYLMHACMYV